MYVYEDQAEVLIAELKASMVEGLDKHQEFLFALLNDDDWSLVIKSHALIESIITDLIVYILEEEELKRIIERLPLHDEQYGKLKIIKTYGLLDEEQRKFIKRLSELRNELVHKFENINFNLPNYISNFDKNQKKIMEKGDYMAC